MFRLRPAFPGGITLPPPRQPMPDGPIRQAPFAPVLFLPLRQGACEPAVAMVREGEEVVRGQLLARGDGEASVPLHASASGTIRAIVEHAEAAGGTVRVIELVPFPGDTQEQGAGPGIDPDTASAEAVIAAVHAAGIVGLDSETPPIHARLRAVAGQAAATLVINGIDLEPGFSRARTVLKAQPADVLAGVRFLLTASGAQRAVLAVEQPDAAAGQALFATAPADLGLSLRVLAPRYPQGVEMLLLRVLDDTPGGRGGPAIETGALCVDVVTVAEIGRLLAKGLSATDQVVSLAGSALREPGHYRVPLGTPVRFLLEHAGLRPDAARVLQGGPMRGEALAGLDAPVSRGSTGFVVLAPEEAGLLAPPMPCIRCGDCLAVCPVQLDPAQLGLLARKGEIEIMHEEYNVNICFECGCCAYVCPSHIPLVQQFRAAKAQWRRRPPAVAGENAT